nr:MAG TPA: hypothetical protein [Crassvirales sp.]DAP92744.1 MAG TPA: hypothetical protein [Caudoviricetes sp.]DAU41541.1 MAG TPA: hypothetical protein [Bacteriophage sp.]
MIGKIHYQVIYRTRVIIIYVELMSLDMNRNGMKMISLITYLLEIVKLEKYLRSHGILHF